MGGKASREKRLAKKACTTSEQRVGQSFNVTQGDEGMVINFNPGRKVRTVDQECVQNHLDKGTFRK